MKKRVKSGNDKQNRGLRVKTNVRAGDLANRFSVEIDGP
jgi:hypothetical protein